MIELYLRASVRVVSVYDTSLFELFDPIVGLQSVSGKEAFKRLGLE